MKSEIALRSEAVEILIDELGLVDAQKFISLIKRDTFDYTEQRRDLYKNMSIDEIYNKAKEFQNRKNPMYRIQKVCERIEKNLLKTMQNLLNPL